MMICENHFIDIEKRAEPGFLEFTETVLASIHTVISRSPGSESC